MSGRTTAEAALDRYRLVYGDGEQVVRETPVPFGGHARGAA
jgi:hypothetical protein